MSEQETLLLEMKRLRDEKAELQRRENELLERIVAAFGNDGIEGSKTTNVGVFKVAVTKPMIYKLANKEFEAQKLANQMNQEELLRLMKWEPKLSVKEYKALEKVVAMENDPNSRGAWLLRQIQDILTIKPGKPQVKVEVTV